MPLGAAAEYDRSRQSRRPLSHPGQNPRGAVPTSDSMQYSSRTKPEGQDEKSILWRSLCDQTNRSPNSQTHMLSTHEPTRRTSQRVRIMRPRA